MQALQVTDPNVIWQGCRPAVDSLLNGRFNKEAQPLLAKDITPNERGVFLIADEEEFGNVSSMGAIKR